MSAPRTKRQFAGAASDPAQRQITSFFTTGNLSSPSSPSPLADIPPRGAQTPNPIQPSLPSSVQTNLLSVGMRVRKSVPEGYKTGSSYGAFALWDESASKPLSSSAPSESRSRANAFSSPRELLPFCGINKVGGLATQPETGAFTASPGSYHRTAIDDDDDYDDMPGLTSSQDTVASTESLTAAAKTRKRSFAEDEDEPADRLGLSLGAGFWGSNVANTGRVMAVPRTGRLRNKASVEAPAAAAAAAISANTPAIAAATAIAGPDKPALEQENVMVVDADDFDEADFLDCERSWEVEMSGI